MSVSILTGFKTVQLIVLNSSHHVVGLICVLITVKGGLIKAEELGTTGKLVGKDGGRNLNTSMDMVHKGFLLRNARMDLGRGIMVMSGNPLKWHARCVYVTVLRRKVCHFY